MNESHIRDILSKNLSILEKGLQLLSIEQYIPKDLGTRSFIDILARDSSGHWVIIEVKKTNAAAREAAHEVFKYVEAVQRHFGARNDEIRAMVVSVEWAELIVPFSRLLSETSISIKGFKLSPDSSGKTLQASPIEPIPVSKGRYLAPWHELNLYKNKSSLDIGIASYKKCCRIKGINDYVLVIMKAAKDFNIQAEKAITETAEQLGFNVEELRNTLLPSLETYEYIIYFAPQILSREFCLSVIARDPELAKEVEEIIEHIDKNAELTFLHENTYDVDPSPHRDHLEIGYAAKFSNKLLVDEGWMIERVIRFGIFERNELLSDDAIIDELKGSNGSSGRSFRRSITIANPAHLSSARDGLNAALASNPAWMSQTRRVLDAIATDYPEYYADINIYNPSAGLFTIYFMATEKDSTQHMPCYEIAVNDADGNLKTVYFGILVPSTEPIAFKEILNKYYKGKLGNLMLLASTGFYESRDSDILDDLGLIYKTFRLDDPHGKPKWLELKDDRWKPFTPKIPYQPLQPYFNKHALLINEISTSIGSRMFGGFHDLS